MKTLITFLCSLSAVIAVDAGELNKLPAEAVDSFKTATKFVLYSLQPEIDLDVKDLGRKLKPAEDHHGYKILGSTELTDAPSREAAIAAITGAVRHFDGRMAACFEPRHSLRTISRNGTTYDFVACFQCNEIFIYRGNKRIGIAGMTGPRKPLDDILRKAKVPQSKPYSPK